jgi:Protein of unknown function (DUF1552)
MHATRFLRRTFLGGLAATAAGAIWRPIMAGAQTGTSPQRLLLIHRPCGSNSLDSGRYWPTGGTTGWTASALLSSFTDGKIASLQNQMVVLKGLTCPRNMNWLGDGHGSGYLGMMTPPPKDAGTNTRPQSTSATPATRADGHSKTITAIDQSIDQLFLSQIPALKGAPCPVPSAQLTASTEASDESGDLHCLRVTSYAKGTNGSLPAPLWPESSPANAFNDYFGSALMNLTPAQIARAASQEKSVLDYAMSSYTALQSQVPPSQLSKVNAHLDAIRQLETNVAASVSAGQCTPPSFPGGPFSPSPPMFSGNDGQGGVTNVGKLDFETYPIWEQQKEIIKTLFMCDLTRVISFTHAYGNSGIHFQNGVFNDPALTGKYAAPNGQPIGDPNGHHDISHLVGTDAQDSSYIVEKYYHDRTAELLAELAATPDVGGGSLLDNTLVVYWTEVSDGAAHGCVDMPVVLFGGKFLKLRGGSFLQLGDPTVNKQFSAGGTYNKGPAPYVSDFWVATAQAWGYTAMTAWGDPSWNTSPVSGLYG